MKRSVLAPLALTLTLTSAAIFPVRATETAPVIGTVAKPYYSTGITVIGTLLDTPETKAVLDAHLPELSADPRVEMARTMTLKLVQSYVPDTFTDEILAKIDADLAKIAPPK